ncbi:MAG: hypothetical protein LBS05_09185 [Tannerellaceae bacterium]|jgi:hypothetical protein|nr:hypothetical protein [Tannerellaceae bacterium]
MRTINLKLFLAVFAVVFVTSYLLGVLRWQWDFASVIYSILNIPFGAIFILVEKYIWEGLGPSHWLNDEITDSLFWILTVFLQAVLYYYAIVKYRLYKQK